MGLETLKQEDINEISENELQHFCDSLSNSLTCDKKFQHTVDYFDTSIGILYNKENPSSLNFCVALLREILCNLKPSHVLWDKVKYAAFLLNLATRNVEFSVLYEIFYQIEDEIRVKNLTWKNEEVRESFDKRITEKLFVKDDVCSLPDLNDSKTDIDIDTNLSNGAVDNLTEDVYDEHFDNDDCGEDLMKEDGDSLKVKEELPKKSRKPASKRLKLAEKKVVKPRRKRRKKVELEDSYEEENIDEDYSEEGDNKKVDESIPKVPCTQCKFKARNPLILERHAFEKHQTNRLCTQCGHLSDTYKDYTKHNETHQYTCEVCSLKILGVRTLRAHMKLHKTKEEKELLDLQGKAKVPCDICGILLLEVSLQTHISQVHSTEIHKCDVCDYTANAKTKVTIHRKNHFVNMSTCPECGKVVKDLKRHFRRNCGAKEKERFFCHLCDKSFSYKMSLDKHIKSIHQKILDHHCHLCEYKTYKKFNLKLHISKMHTKIDMKKTCTFCNLKTTNLDYHIKIYHYDAHLKNQAYLNQSSISEINV